VRSYGIQSQVELASDLTECEVALEQAEHSSFAGGEACGVRLGLGLGQQLRRFGLPAWRPPSVGVPVEHVRRCGEQSGRVFAAPERDERRGEQNL
jgi:hypothetical protein